ncbi:MAG: hypothetical protein NC238_14030 [Dehalobacter sp.]|nr:hypothetical protein [Dehalobacter sp.]
MEPSMGNILSKINIKPQGNSSHVNKILPIHTGSTLSTCEKVTTGTNLLLRTVHGEPESRPIMEWSNMASRAKRIWLQGKGTVQSQIASIEYCYFSSVVRWLKTLSGYLTHPILNMAYPAELTPYINHSGIFI